MSTIANQDKTLVCQDCGKDFTFTAAEQDFYQQKGFTNEPKRCPDCRRIKKDQFRGRHGGGRGHNDSFQITCAQCGKTDTVPFKPRGDRPVLCSDCFKKQREGGVHHERPTEQPAPMQSESADMQQGEEMPVTEE